MHLRKPNRPAAFTWVEMLVVIVCVVVVALVILPRMARATTRAARIHCINNLKNIGLAFRIFATDSEGSFPWQLSPTNRPAQLPFGFGEMPGTSLPTAAGVSGWFAAVSNELSTPNILVCPHDTQRYALRTNSFAFLMAPAQAGVRNGAISYFLATSAREGDSQSLLAGDRNLAGGPFSDSPTVPPSQVALRIPLTKATNETTFASAVWTPAIHQGNGNLLSADGSVQQTTSRGMRGQFLKSARAATNDLDFLWPEN